MIRGSRSWERPTTARAHPAARADEPTAVDEAVRDLYGVEHIIVHRRGSHPGAAHEELESELQGGAEQQQQPPQPETAQATDAASPARSEERGRGRG